MTGDRCAATLRDFITNTTNGEGALSIDLTVALARETRTAAGHALDLGVPQLSGDAFNSNEDAEASLAVNRAALQQFVAHTDDRGSAIAHALEIALNCRVPRGSRP